MTKRPAEKILRPLFVSGSVLLAVRVEMPEPRLMMGSMTTESTR